MATLFNNTEITNAFFNGTELDKIYFNGVLVFEKGGKYLRRIMVGDNLRNRMIYATFPTNYYLNLEERNVSTTGNKYIICNNGEPYDNIYHIFMEFVDDSKILGNYNEYYSGSSGILIEPVYYRRTPDTQIEMINNSGKAKNDIDYIVTSVISDNASYKHIFIEDENIRPFEVGDIILNTTKIYFSIPDNYFTDIWTEDDNKNNRIILIKEKGKENVTYPHPALVSSWKGGESFKFGAVNLQKFGYSWPANGELYNLDKGTLIKNSSYITFSELKFRDFNIDIGGEVFNVNKNSTIYPYILVDTRTLG